MAKDKSYLICRCNQFFALGPFSPNHSCSLNAISGRKGGRKPKMTDSKIESAKKLLASGVPPKDVAKNLGVSIPTLYRWVPASTHA